MKNIIVAVDFSVASTNAAAYALKLAAYYQAKLWMFNAFELPVTYSEYGYPFVNAAELKNAADFQMQQLVERLPNISNQAVNIETRVELINLMDGLQSLCNETNAELVVMGITGKDALTRLLIGSNTIHAIHQLNCPLLIVPKNSSYTAYKKLALQLITKKEFHSKQ